MGVGSTFHDFIDMQATMLQPVGGMDQIPRAFETALGPVVRKGCIVTKIARKGAGVEVSYREAATGAMKHVEADYCLVNIPLKVLSAITSDFSPDRKAAIDRAVYANSIKIAFQSPRFWERENHIYGGLSFTDRDTFITWYPSGKFHSPEGVLVAGYAFAKQADRFGALPLNQRIAYARGTVERVPPGRAGPRLLRPAQRGGRAVLLRWRAPEPCGRLAAGRLPILPPRHRPAGRPPSWWGAGHRRADAVRRRSSRARRP